MNTLNVFKKYINHYGKLYKNSECYTLTINNESLYNFFKSHKFTSDKRYSVKFINPPKEMIPYYIRGLFDGDGCLYYKYISGVYEEKTWQITSGSKLIAEGLVNCIKKELNIDLNIHKKISSAGNEYYDIICNITEDILKLCKFIYNDHTKLSLSRKLKSYLKLKSLINLDKQVNDIVDASMKIEE